MDDTTLDNTEVEVCFADDGFADLSAPSNAFDKEGFGAKTIGSDVRRARPKVADDFFTRELQAEQLANYVLAV